MILLNFAAEIRI